MNDFACPHCGRSCRVGVAACPGCGMRLTGPDAARLWEVHQQIARLQAEADRLLAVLTAPGPVAYAGVEPLPVARRDAAPTSARRGLSGQQLLLGLGALLLLSAAAFFLLVAWMLVGLVGQAAIMLALTAAAVAAAPLAVRRGLRAAAETAAALASGLVLIDLAGARARGLSGLDGVPALQYWTLVLPCAGAVLLLADQLVPRTVAGRPVRPVHTYRPAASALLALTPWLALGWADPRGAAVPAGLLVVALVNALTAAGLWRLAPRRSTALPVPAAALIPLVAAVAGVLGHEASGLLLGYDLDRASGDRFVVCGLLMIVPTVLALLSAVRSAPARDRLPIAAVALAFPALPILLLTAPPVVFAVVAAALAVVLGATGAGERVGTRDGDRVTLAWRRALLVAGAAAQPLLVVGVEWREAITGVTGVTGVTGSTYPTPVLVVPALAWLATALVAVGRTRRTWWLAAGHLAAAATVTRLVADLDAGWWVGTALAGFLCCTVLAVVAVHRSGAGRPSGFWRRVEESALLAGTGYAVAALGSATEVGRHEPQTVAAALFVLGTATLVYAASPRRLGFAYVGSLAISAGTDVLAADAGVGAIEAYTLPLALLLAGVGLLQWRRDHGLPTFLTTGPATSVALVPTTLVAIGTGDSARLALAGAAGVAALLLGLAGRWKAPVTLGGAVLTLLAVTQGGPYAAYLPGWMTLGLAGAVLVAVGVSWEQAVVTGRRAEVWYRSLS